MSSRLGRAVRGLFFVCLGLATLPAMGQMRQEGAIPDGRGGVGVLETGVHHTCGLRQDGTAACWGDNYSGEAKPLPGTFIELSAGAEHTCGLRGDGRVECWGRGYTPPEGSPPPPEGAPPPPSPIPPGTYTALATGVSTTCGLRVREQPWQYPEGNVACWSGDGWGPQLPAPPAGDFVALSVGDMFACGLRADGRAACWGWPMDRYPVPADETFVAITAGAFHACGLRADGSARCWGENWDGQTDPPTELFTAISAGMRHTCGLRTDGRAQCWGANDSNQTTPPAEDRFIALSVGGFHSCGVRTDGRMACWGDVRWRWDPPMPPAPPPMYPPWEGVFGMGQLAAGDWHQCQLTPQGRLSCWGGFNSDPAPWARFSAVSSGQDATCARSDEMGALLQCFGGNGEIQQNLPIEPLRQFDLGYEHGCGVLALDGRARCWGRETNGKTLAPEGLFRTQSAGLMHSCGVRADGNAECWGYNGDGQTEVKPLLPERGYLNVEAGERHSCGLDSDLHIRCWGMSPPPYDPNNWDPDYHPDFATFRALSVGAYHSCAIRTNGTLLCWGEDWAGQLHAPEGTFVSVSAGHTHTCAIRTDGSRECWGQPWMTPKLVLDPAENIRGVRPGEWLSVQFQLRSESPHPVQEPTYAIVAGALPWGFRLEPNGELRGSWHETGRFPITVEGRDRNGFVARREYVLSIDDTPPVIEPQISGKPGENGWYVSPIEVTWSVTDAQSDIRFAHGCDPVRVEHETSDAFFSCHAESGGGWAFNEVQVKVDLSYPVAWVRSFDNAGASATIEFEGHDPMSGIAGFECALDDDAFAPCASPLQGTYKLGPHDMQIRAVDVAGHRSEPTHKTWFTDTTPPEVTATVSGPRGANDWYIGDVQIQWQLRDDETPISSAVGCEAATLSSDALQATYTCTASSQGGTTVREVVVKRDATPPDTTITAKPEKVTNANSATFEFDGSDATSGVIGFECRFDSSYQWQPCISPKRYDNLGHGQHSFYVRSIDASGNRDELEAGYAFVIDTTPPQIIASQSAYWGNNGWAISDVQISFAIHEPESSYTSTPGCETSTQNVDTVGHDITCSATSVGGTTTRTTTVRRDTTAPETRFTTTPASVTNANASFAFAGDDATSGIAWYECSLDGAAYATCTSPFQAYMAAGTHSFAVRAIDKAGNRDASPATHSWLVDTTPPEVTPSVVGTLGNNGWYVGDVQISWSVSDAESAISTATGCNTVTLTTDSFGTDFTCTATSVGGTTSRKVSVKRDTVAPTVAISRFPVAWDNGIWVASSVRVSYTCTDAMSGVSACIPEQVFDNEGQWTTTPGVAVDAAGNRRTSGTITVGVDRTAPVLAPKVGAGVVLLKAVAAAAANASDALSGVASQSCATPDTATVGDKVVACEAYDVATNRGTAGGAYRVIYGWQGFSAPVANPATLNVIKAGRAIPFRWRLVDAAGAGVPNLPISNFTEGVVTCPTGVPTQRISTYGGTSLTLKNFGDGYYGKDRPTYSSYRGSCRRFDLHLGDGEVHSAIFKFD